MSSRVIHDYLNIFIIIFSLSNSIIVVAQIRILWNYPGVLLSNTYLTFSLSANPDGYILKIDGIWSLFITVSTSLVQATVISFPRWSVDLFFLCFLLCFKSATGPCHSEKAVCVCLTQPFKVLYDLPTSLSSFSAFPLSFYSNHTYLLVFPWTYQTHCSSLPLDFIFAVLFCLECRSSRYSHNSFPWLFQIAILNFTLSERLSLNTLYEITASS